MHAISMTEMKMVSVRMPAALALRLKLHAARSHQTIAALIVELVRREVSRAP